MKLNDDERTATANFQLLATKRFRDAIADGRVHRTWFGPSEYLDMKIDIQQKNGLSPSQYLMYGEYMNPSKVEIVLKELHDMAPNIYRCSVYMKDNPASLQQTITNFIDRELSIARGGMHQHWSHPIRLFVNSLKVPMQYCWVDSPSNVDYLYIANPRSMIADGYAEMWRDAAGMDTPQTCSESSRIHNYYDAESDSFLPIFK